VGACIDFYGTLCCKSFVVLRYFSKVVVVVLCVLLVVLY
jgi:hypothetical protein